MENLSVPSVPGEAGNTIASPKLVNPAKHWCFTLNNPTEDERIRLKNLDVPTFPIIIWQDEVGEEGTHHLQGCFSLTKKMRPKKTLGLPRIHLESKSKNSTLLEMRAYCCDKEKRKEGGELYLRGWKPPRELILISPDLPFELEILKIISEEPDNRTIYWYWSEKGGIGKTCFCKYLVKVESAIMLSGKTDDMKYGITEYVKKQGYTPELVLYNIPKSQTRINYGGLEVIKDMVFFSPKYEGAMVCGNSPHLIIFANMEPTTTEMSEDRWIIRKID